MDFGNYTLFDVGAIVWCRIAILSKFYYARDSYSERMLYSIDISLYIARKYVLKFYICNNNVVHYV